MSDQTRHIQAARSYVVYRQTPLPLFMNHGYCSPVISPDQSVLDREQGLVSKVVSVRRKWCNEVEQGVALAPSQQKQRGHGARATGDSELISPTRGVLASCTTSFR